MYHLVKQFFFIFLNRTIDHTTTMQCSHISNLRGENSSLLIDFFATLEVLRKESQALCKLSTPRIRAQKDILLY